LAEVSKTATDIGTKYTYLSRIAYFLYKKDRTLLSPKELSNIHQNYCDVYQLPLIEPQMISELTRAKILCKEGDLYRFVYKGIYCYCVARYFFENIASSEAPLRTELDEMTDRLAWEDYTNIVMFYLYLSRDQRTIDRLLANAAMIYQECEPANLDSDVDFINQLIREKPQKLLLQCDDIAINRDQYRTEQDAIEGVRKTESEAAPDNRVPYEPSLHELVKINIALQSLRVMGQVLRNFPGVLTAEPKYRLAEASYLLGLRTLRRVLFLAEHQMQALRTGFAEIFRERHPLITPEQLAQRADQSLIWLTGAAAYGVIKRICRSVGLRELQLTFEEVCRRLEGKTSVKLIDLSIHLEYFRETPHNEIYDLEKALRRNYFSYKILRDLVSEFLYLRNTDRQLSQKMGELFEIETSNPQYMLNKAVGAETKSPR
jgi:hypothetical protein